MLQLLSIISFTVDGDKLLVMQLNKLLRIPSFIFAKSESAYQPDTENGVAMNFAVNSKLVSRLGSEESLARKLSTGQVPWGLS